MNNTFDIFDTVVVQHKNGRTIRSKEQKGYFIAGYENSASTYNIEQIELKKTFDIVIIGYYNNNNSSYVGNSIYISSTKMVLVEKADFRLRDAFELSNRILNSGAAL